MLRRSEPHGGEAAETPVVGEPARALGTPTVSTWTLLLILAHLAFKEKRCCGVGSDASKDMAKRLLEALCNRAMLTMMHLRLANECAVDRSGLTLEEDGDRIVRLPVNDGSVDLRLLAEAYLPRRLQAESDRIKLVVAHARQRHPLIAVPIVEVIRELLQVGVEAWKDAILCVAAGLSEFLRRSSRLSMRARCQRMRTSCM